MTPEPWVRRLAARPGADTVLLCFPHAGGAASAYRDWPALLPAHVEPWAVQYPGRENRSGEALIDDLRALADAAAAAIEPALDRPVVVFGHSMGASVAHEFTLRLRPGPVRALVVSARPGPARQKPRTTPVHLRDDLGILAELDLLGGAPVPADPELRALLLPMIRSDFRLIETYRPGADRLAVDLTVISGDADPSLLAEDTRCWRKATTGRFDRHVLPGGHFYLTDHLRAVTSLVVAAAEREDDTMSEHGDVFSPDGLRAAIAEVLDVPSAEVTDDASLFELGLDSMRMMMLSARWQAYGVEVPFGALAERPTITAWSALLTAGVR